MIEIAIVTNDATIPIISAIVVRVSPEFLGPFSFCTIILFTLSVSSISETHPYVLIY